MSPRQRSPMGAGTLTPSRRRTGMIPRATSTPGPLPDSPSYLSLNAAHGRVSAALRRAASVLEADVELSLPQVSVNDLERAVSTFLNEIRLGLPREGTSSSQTPSSGHRSYGRRLRTEITDPELAARVKKNRKAVEVELMDTLKLRNRK